MPLLFFPRFCRHLERSLYFLGGAFGIDSPLLVGAGIRPEEACRGDLPEEVPDALLLEEGVDFAC
jgi:hypothetical protein